MERITRSRSLFQLLSIFLLHHLHSISSSQAPASSLLTWTTEALSLWFLKSGSTLVAANLAALPPSRGTTPPRSTWSLMQLPWAGCWELIQTNITLLSEAQSFNDNSKRGWTAIQIINYSRYSKWHKWEHLGCLDSRSLWGLGRLWRDCGLKTVMAFSKAQADVQTQLASDPL